ncbi:hypothetical protein K488DRAFT_91250 [Vararia minispora EC-137]|uniref:Uncharacterized protein n=1 Tax=Vararia minispora EC-137 TaxID=1314806 RepID=A0ACB8Q5T1_9AGAM|nr:hypothetical protein K488DRAFT_91250 [Vararia minispora EC-137]
MQPTRPHPLQGMQSFRSLPNAPGASASRSALFYTTPSSGPGPAPAPGPQGPPLLFSPAPYTPYHQPHWPPGPAAPATSAQVLYPPNAPFQFTENMVPSRPVTNSTVAARLLRAPRARMAELAPDQEQNDGTGNGNGSNNDGPERADSGASVPTPVSRRSGPAHRGRA